ncbi:unnamed protein product [Brassica rapa]|uniref:Uncharacterized protein n=1 Tax=Brassica campestris TaxID=3711 RepID=A0A3P6BZ05_BRACM|nr:unnamed protein product [Brassica rapa]VDD11547.1 unnamed protein product [Brassica rapa]
MRGPISVKDLAGFYKKVKTIIVTISFENARYDYHLNHFFKNTIDTMEEIEALFNKDINASSEGRNCQS